MAAPLLRDAVVAHASPAGSAVTDLPSGAHAEVLLVDDPREGRTVVKVIRGDGFFFRDSAGARQFGDNILNYRTELLKHGVSTTPNLQYDVLESAEVGTLLILRMPYLGQDLQEQVVAGRRTATDASALILRCIEPLFVDRRLPTGLDPKVTNFTCEGDRPARIIDFTPPRLWRNGAPNLGLMTEQTPEALALEQWRHFTRIGVLTVLQNQASRIDPRSRPLIKQLIADFLESRGLDHELHELTHAASECVLRQSRYDRRRTIAELGADRMYDLREIAVEFCSAGTLPQPSVERIFQLTRLSGQLAPPEHIRLAQEILMAHA